MAASGPSNRDDAVRSGCDGSATVFAAGQTFHGEWQVADGQLCTAYAGIRGAGRSATGYLARMANRTSSSSTVSICLRWPTRKSKELSIRARFMGFRYFAYGSNIGWAGLDAKGVRASCSVPGRVQGWQISFDVPSAFRRLDGGVANISQSAKAGDYVLGTVHLIDDEAEPVLDVIEARGVLYERRPLEVEVDGAERVIAETYVGLDEVRDPALRPSIRYLKILIDGAVEWELAPTYIDHIRATETHQPPDITPFKLAGEGLRWLDAGGLAEHPGWVALYGIVFDVDRPRPAHAFIR